MAASGSSWGWVCCGNGCLRTLTPGWGKAGFLITSKLFLLLGEKTAMKKPINKWSDADRRSFQDGQRLRAQTIPNKKLASNKNACRKFKHNKGEMQ